MNDKIITTHYLPDIHTHPVMLIVKTARVTSEEEVLDIIVANLKDDGTLCDDFKDDLLWLVSLKDQSIEIRKKEWSKRVDKFRKSNGNGNDLITEDQAIQIIACCPDVVDVNGVPLIVDSFEFDSETRTVKLSMSATWL